MFSEEIVTKPHVKMLLEKHGTYTAEEILNEIPLSRFGKPEEVGKLIEFLITDEASYITGQTIHINGGLYM